MTPPPKFKPFVPEGMQMREFTWRAVLLGLVMCVVLGAANAYLGLRAGQTIAATYPAAVIGMAILRLGKGSILEENIARTAGLIGQSGGGGRGVHAAGIRHGERLGIVRFAGGLLEIDGTDAGGQRARRAVRIADPACDGGGSRIAIPRICGGGRGPQGGTGPRQNGEVSLLQHRLRGGHVPGRRVRDRKSVV